MSAREVMEEHRRRFVEALRVRGQSASTIRLRRDSLAVLFRFMALQGMDDVREVTRETARAYLLWLSRQSYTAWTVHVHWQGVRLFFAWLEKTDVILLNPCAGVAAPKTGEHLPRGILSKKQALAILDQPDTQTPKGIRDKAILEMFYASGVRCEEMAGLTIHDVDCQNGFVRVNNGKGGKDRVVPIGRKAADYVREYLQKVRRVWSDTPALKDERALWLSAIRPHGPITTQAIAVMTGGYLRAAGVKQGRAHLWRHTCATHLVASGANIACVQRLLGHRSIETTQRYSHISIPEVKETFVKKHPRQRKGKTQKAPNAAAIRKRR